MIEGKILVTRRTLDLWLQEALTRDLDQARGDEDIWRDDGAGIIRYRVELHCETWDFYGADRQRLHDEAMSVYIEAKKFFTPPNQSGT